jgi:hypothetical protein
LAPSSKSSFPAVLSFTIIQPSSFARSSFQRSSKVICVQALFYVAIHKESTDASHAFPGQSTVFLCSLTVCVHHSRFVPCIQSSWPSIFVLQGEVTMNNASGCLQTRNYHTASNKNPALVEITSSLSECTCRNEQSFAKVTSSAKEPKHSCLSIRNPDETQPGFTTCGTWNHALLHLLYIHGCPLPSIPADL